VLLCFCFLAPSSSSGPPLTQAEWWGVRCVLLCLCFPSVFVLSTPTGFKPNGEPLGSPLCAFVFVFSSSGPPLKMNGGVSVVCCRLCVFPPHFRLCVVRPTSSSGPPLASSRMVSHWSARCVLLCLCLPSLLILRTPLAASRMARLM